MTSSSQGFLFAFSSDYLTFNIPNWTAVGWTKTSSKMVTSDWVAEKTLLTFAEFLTARRSINRIQLLFMKIMS